MNAIERINEKYRRVLKDYLTDEELSAPWWPELSADWEDPELVFPSGAVKVEKAETCQSAEDNLSIDA